MTLWLTRQWLTFRQDDPERGDVPGWVMVTLMTAGLVVILWGVAGDRLQDLFNASMDRILQHQ